MDMVTDSQEEEWRLMPFDIVLIVFTQPHVNAYVHLILADFYQSPIKHILSRLGSSPPFNLFNVLGVTLLNRNHM